jgi:hypothetical protein
MKPDTDFMLRAIAAELGSRIYPEVETSYGKANLEQIIQLLVALAEDFDTTASRRIEENKQIRLLFAEAMGSVGNDDLKMRLEKAANETETDYRISALDKINQNLFALLRELHEHVETLEGDDERKLEQAIWQALQMKIMRRVPIIMAAAGAAGLVDKQTSQ